MTWGEVDFTNGVAAVAVDADTDYFDAEGYAIDTSKHVLTLLDTLTITQLQQLCNYLGVSYTSETTKQALVRAIETSVSTKYIAEVVVTSGAGSLKAGTLTINVASALLAGGSKNIDVDVEGDDATTANVATAIRSALAADEDIAAYYTISGANADIILTANDAAGNDATLAITLIDDDGVGITVGASGNTIAGTAPVQQAESITVTTGSDKIATLIMTVTSALLDTGSKDYNVPVTADDDSVEEVATAIYDVLAADSDLTDHYALTREGAKLTITALVAAENDGTLAWALTSADTSTVAVGVSTAEAGGVAGVQQVETVAVSGVADVENSVITITGEGVYKYKIAADALAPLYMDDVSSWTDIVSGDEISGEYAGQTITVARVNASGGVLGLGSAVIAIT
jgi:hypothetical protein